MKLKIIQAIITIYSQLSFASQVQIMQSKSIGIKRKDIEISLEAVNIATTYVNKATFDINQTMVFPLQEILPNASNDNLKQFKLIVNSREIPYKTFLQPVSFLGQNISELLNKIDVSPEPMLAMRNLSTSQYQELLKNDLIIPNTNKAKWQVKKFYYWEQQFPVAEEVHIRYSYKPSFSSSVESILEPSIVEMPKPSYLRDILKRFSDKQSIQSKTVDLSNFIKEFCPHITNPEQLSKQFSTSKHKIQKLIIPMTRDNYWLGPIDFFTLRINYPTGSYPLVCWENPMTRASSNDFIFSAENFFVTNDLKIMYVIN